jgi:hypothetical protein
MIVRQWFLIKIELGRGDQRKKATDVQFERQGRWFLVRVIPFIIMPDERENTELRFQQEFGASCKSGWSRGDHHGVFT